MRSRGVGDFKRMSGHLSLNKATLPSFLFRTGKRIDFYFLYEELGFLPPPDVSIFVLGGGSNRE